MIYKITYITLQDNHSNHIQNLTFFINLYQLLNYIFFIILL